LSQELEQDLNAAGAVSNSDSDSDSDSDAFAKLPRNRIGLKSSKKRKAIGSDQDDASAIVNAFFDSDSDDDKKPAATPTQSSESNPSPGSLGFNRLMSTLENDADPLGQCAATMHVQSPSASAANEEPVVGLKPKRAVPRKQPKAPAEIFDMSNDTSTTDDDDNSGTEVETGTAKAGGDDTLFKPEPWMLHGLGLFSTKWWQPSKRMLKKCRQEQEEFGGRLSDHWTADCFHSEEDRQLYHSVAIDYLIHQAEYQVSGAPNASAKDALSVHIALRCAVKGWMSLYPSTCKEMKAEEERGVLTKHRKTKVVTEFIKHMQSQRMDELIRRPPSAAGTVSSCRGTIWQFSFHHNP